MSRVYCTRYISTTRRGYMYADLPLLVSKYSVYALLVCCFILFLFGALPGIAGVLGSFRIGRTSDHSYSKDSTVPVTSYYEYSTRSYLLIPGTGCRRPREQYSFGRHSTVRGTVLIVPVICCRKRRRYY